MPAISFYDEDDDSGHSFYFMDNKDFPRVGDHIVIQDIEYLVVRMVWSTEPNDFGKQRIAAIVRVDKVR